MDSHHSDWQKWSQNTESSQQPINCISIHTDMRCTQAVAHSRRNRHTHSHPPLQSCVIIQAITTSVSAALTISEYSKEEHCVT